MHRSIVYYLIYAFVIIVLAAAIILAFRPKASAPAPSSHGTIGVISEKTGVLTVGSGSGLQSNTANPNLSSSQPATASGTRSTSSTTTTIATPNTTVTKPTTTTNGSSTSSSSTSSQLVNTGPGSAATVFVASVAIGAALHWSFKRYAFAKNS